MSIRSEGEEDIQDTENAALPKESKRPVNSIEVDVDLLTEQENKVSLSPSPSQERSVLKNNWWNVLWGLATLFACFVSIATFGFVASDEPWAGVSILLLTFALIGFYTASSFVHRKRYKGNKPKKENVPSNWKGMLAESMREDERYNWTLIAAFFFFAMLAVTNFYKSNSVGILFTVCAGITGIAIAYSIGFQYWGDKLVGPEPFIAVESLIDVYLGSNVFVRGVDQLQFAFGYLSIVVAVLAAAVCQILLTHRQLTRRIWDRKYTPTPL